MEDWSDVPVFGVCPTLETCVLRWSAYGLIRDVDGRLAVVRTPRGVYLPGGGIEEEETPEEALSREVLEECGMIIQPGVWVARAVQFTYSEPKRTHFEKRSVFIEGAITGHGLSPSEMDHELIWMDAAEAIRQLSHQSHGWAVELWRKRLTQR
jgi:8-oxo-dGTP diphosphatase